MLSWTPARVHDVLDPDPPRLTGMVEQRALPGQQTTRTASVRQRRHSGVGRAIPGIQCSSRSFSSPELTNPPSRSSLWAAGVRVRVTAVETAGRPSSPIGTVAHHKPRQILSVCRRITPTLIVIFSLLASGREVEIVEVTFMDSDLSSAVRVAVLEPIRVGE